MDGTIIFLSDCFDTVGYSSILSFLLNLCDVDFYYIFYMLNMRPTTWAAMVFINQLQHSQGLSFGYIGWHTSCLCQLLSCLCIAAHLLEDWSVIGCRLNQSLAVLIKRLEKCIPVFCVDVAQVLYVRSYWLVESLARFQVGSPCLVHCDIEEMSSRMDSRVESALRLINVAIDLAANLESCASWLKLANV